MDYSLALNSALEHLSEAIIVTDNSDNIMYVSPNCSSVIGLSEKVVRGKGRLRQFLQYLDSNVFERNGTNLPTIFELTFCLENGPTRSLKVKTVATGACENRSYLFTDISENISKNNNSCLQEQVVSRLTEGVCMMRENTFELLYVNRQLQKMLDIDPCDYLGKHISLLFSQLDPSQEHEMVSIEQSLLENDSWTKDIFSVQRQDTTYWIKLTITHIAHRDYGWVWLVVCSDVTALKQNEENLRKLNEELGMRFEERTAELQRKNIALAEVMNQLEIERSNLARKIDVNTQKLLLPVLERLIEKSSSLDSRYLTMIKQNLQTLTSSFGFKLSGSEYKLTPKELELCTLIKGGFTIKEIATMQNLSERTVETHRFNIRRKFGICSKKVNLASFLTEL